MSKKRLLAFLLSFGVISPGIVFAEVPPAPPQPEESIPVEMARDTGFIYDPTGKRDPFKSFFGDETPRVEDGGGPVTPVDSLEAYDLNQLKLIAVLLNGTDPKGMVRSPTGKSFLVRERTKIGRNNGYIAAIREGEIVVVEMSQDGKTPSPRTLSLQK